MYRSQPPPQDLEALNRDKVACILQYLDDVDNESCCSSVVAAPYSANHFKSTSATTLREPSIPLQQQHHQQQYSPSPSNPHLQHHHQDPMLASYHYHHHQQQQARSMSASFGRQQQQQDHQQQSLSPSAQSSVSQQAFRHATTVTSAPAPPPRAPSSQFEGSVVSCTTATANAQYTNLRRKVNNIVAERDAAQRQVDALKAQLQAAEERERSRIGQISEQAHEDNAKSRKQMQSAVDEHLRCIRKLLSEKESLIKKVEELQAEVTSSTSKRDAEMKRLRELHEKSLSDLRSRLSAQERAKRDEWSQKEAKRIKESTMKAMEPDIALLLNRHKAEKKRLEDELADAIQKRDHAAAHREREVSEFKNKLLRDMEDSSQRERETFRAQMQDQTDRLMRMLEEEKRMQDERRRNLEKNHEEVRQSLVEQVTDMARKLAEAESREQHRRCSSSADVADAVAKAQQEMAEQHKMMRDALEKERASLAESVKLASEQLLEARAADIRQQCQNERDIAISRVVAKLEQEQLKALQESRESEKRWKDVNGQLQRETDRLRTELDCAAAHFRSAKESVTDRDERIKHLQEQVVNLRHVANADSAATEEAFERRLAALDNSWQQRVQSVQAEHVRNTASLSAEVDHLKRQIQLLREEHATASSVSAQKHSAELAVINERVALTLNKKDAHLRQLADTIANLERQVQLRDEELARHDALLNEAGEM